MKILVLGASGRTGRQVTQMAVARSHVVTTLVRSAASFGEHRELRVVVGDPASPSDIESATDTVLALAHGPLARRQCNELTWLHIYLMKRNAASTSEPLSASHQADP